MNKTFTYKEWLCEWSEEKQLYCLYHPTELIFPRGLRRFDVEFPTREQAEDYITNYQIEQL